jgi:hypothetical protein
MQELKTEIKISKDRTLKQLKREGMVAIYELFGPGNILYGYEVIRIKIREAGEVFGTHYPVREIYPASEEWGRYGWTYGVNYIDKAMARFNGLVREEQKSEVI